MIGWNLFDGLCGMLLIGVMVMLIDELSCWWMWRVSFCDSFLF